MDCLDTEFKPISSFFMNVPKLAWKGFLFLWILEVSMGFDQKHFREDFIPNLSDLRWFLILPEPVYVCSGAGTIKLRYHV